MPLLRSKKISFIILAALITVNWFVGQRAVDNGASSTTDSPPHHAASSHLPTLESIQSWPPLRTDQVSSRFQRFSAPIFIASLPTTQTAPSQVEPIRQLTDSTLAAPADRISSGVPALQMSNDMNASNASNEMPVSAHVPHEKKHTPRSEDLLKLLAAFYLLNR